MGMKKKGCALLLAATVTAGMFSVARARPQTVSAAEATFIKVNPSVQKQTFDGWGTSLAWWADLVGNWSSDAKNQLMDLAFDKDKGLGLNIVRYNIGGALSPQDTNLRPGGAIMSYMNPDGTYDWTKDAGQRWVLNQAISKINPNELITEAFSNSPPYFMTISGQSSGGAGGSSNLQPDKYQAFADYLTTVVKHFRDYWGVNFNTIEPMNEPDGNWTQNGKQEGCDFDQPYQKDNMYAALKTSISSAGLSAGMTGFDEYAVSASITDLQSASADTISSLSRIQTHEYGGGSLSYLRDMAATYGKKLYMSEVCQGSTPYGVENMDSGLAEANIIYRDLNTMQASAWCMWQLADDALLHQQVNQNWDVIGAVWSGPDVEKYYVTKQYYTIGQFSKYIRPGYKIIDSGSPDVVAAIDPTSQQLVLVMQNTSVTNKNTYFDLSQFDTAGATVKAYRTSPTENLADVSSEPSLQNGYLSNVLPGKSITTYVVSGAKYTGEIGTPVNDKVLGTGNNQFTYSTPTNNWTYASSQSGAYSGDCHYTAVTNCYYQMKFSGNRVKIYSALAPDAGIAGISIDGGAETMVDMYAATRQDAALTYVSPLLTPGTHTVKVRVTGNKNPASSSTRLYADEVVAVQNGTDATITTGPQINLLSPGNGNLLVRFSPVAGAAFYHIKYGTQSGNYTGTIDNVTSTQYLLTGLQNGQTYYVAVTADVNGQQTRLSNEMAETPHAPADPDLLYFVNAGDTTPYTLEQGEQYGINNTLEDQPYGADPQTGAKWGYVCDENSTWSQDAQGSYGVSWGCMRQYDASTTVGKGFDYKFDVPDGQYLVTLGFYDPWSMSNRLEDISINGSRVASSLLPCSAAVSKIPQHYVANVTGGTLDVRIQNAAGAGSKPLVSFLKVQKYKQVQSISMEQSASVEKGQTLTLHASLQPSDASYTAVTWASGDPTVATVSGGVVTTLKEGQTTITATSADNPAATATCRLTVVPMLVERPVTSLSLNYSSMQMGYNDSYRLQPVFEPYNASVQTVTWASSDPSVVQVAPDGTVKPTGYGTATVTATSWQDTTKTAACTVTVTKGYDLYYQVNCGSTKTSSLFLGEDTPQLNSKEDQAYGTDPATGKKWGYTVTNNNIWRYDARSSNGNNMMYTILDYEGNEAGSGVTYQFELPSGSYHVSMGFYTPYYSSTRVQDIIVNGTTMVTKLVPGSNLIQKDFYGVQPVNGTITLSSVNSAGGGLHPLISYILIRKDEPATSVSISKTALTLTVGGTTQLSAFPDPWQASLSGSVAWSSDNENVATVDSAGNVTAVAPGDVTITAASPDGLQSADCAVHVVSADGTLNKTLSFDLNGSTATPPAQQTVTRGTLAAQPAPPIRPGYLFVGWNTARNGSGTAWNFSSTAMPAQDVTLYAQWSKQRFLDRIMAGTTTAQLAQSLVAAGACSSADTVSVTTAQGPLAPSAAVGTGMTVTIGSDSWQAAVTGDLTGDGALSSADLLLVKRHILGMEQLSDASLAAANVDHDAGGDVNASDLLLIKRGLLGLAVLS